MGIDQPLLATARLAEVLNEEPVTLRIWTQRVNPPVRMAPDGRSSRASRDISENAGIVLWTERRAMHIALVVALVRLGVPVRDASAIAEAFTEEGGCGGPGDIWARGEERDPGELFKNGKTLLVYSAIHGAQVVRSEDERFNIAEVYPARACVVVDVELTVAPVKKEFQKLAERR